MKNMIERIHSFFDPPRYGTVLVIDDSEVDRAFAVGVLSRRHHVLAATGAKEGLQIAFKEKPDLIILDYMMPEMTGPEVCRVLKQNYGMDDVPVVFLTSMNMPEALVNSLEEGAEAYLTKPVNARELLAEVALRIKRMSSERKDV